MEKAEKMNVGKIYSGKIKQMGLGVKLFGQLYAWTLSCSDVLQLVLVVGTGKSLSLPSLYLEGV